MNELNLRMVHGGSKRSRNSIGFPPVVLPNTPKLETDDNRYYRSFTNTSSTDEQLTLLRDLLNGSSDPEPALLDLLATVFLMAEAKHPVKCFITRHITKTEKLRQPFTISLAEQIKMQIDNKPSTYLEYIPVVSRIATCIDNFPAGAAALRISDVTVAAYMVDCLECSIEALSGNQSLSPTERNEIFNLSHLALRLLLYIVQKVEDSIGKLSSLFMAIKAHIKWLMFDQDVPMDTKSVGGILYLTIHMTENGPDSWLDILNNSNSEINSLMSCACARLALRAATCTCVCPLRLRSPTARGEPAVLALVEDIVNEIHGSSESTHTLGVTRTLLQVSKMLDKVGDSAVPLVQRLLPFVWQHLEHYMDSVRHLTAQMLDHIVRYCTRLQKEGDDTVLKSLFCALSLLDKHRKSYYVTVTSLANAMGASSLLERLPDVIADVMAALHLQAVQACATVTLETLLQKHVRESNPETIYQFWIVPMLSHVGSVDSSVLNVLEQLMAKAVALDDRVMEYIVPHIEASCSRASSAELRRVLALLLVSRRAKQRRHLVAAELLRRAALDANDETRILSLSLVVESPKSTEEFSAEELAFVLFYVRYNINAQSPNFRQLTLSLMKKFMKRLEDSFKVIKRQKEADKHNKVVYYTSFVEELRALCYGSLLRGANYSRRFVALQILHWTEYMEMEGFDRIWLPEYVDRLLVHLEDSYENNKQLALDVLERVPGEMFKDKKYSISLDLEDILVEASSLKPTDCVSAAYKLNFLWKKLPENILQGNTCTAVSPALFVLLRRLVQALRSELCVAERSLARAARSAAMHGLLHCARQLLPRLQATAISSDPEWTDLIDETISTCLRVSACVAPVVSSASPEGHLPMDCTGVSVHDYGNTGGVVLDSGRPVTAQMLLLCAWRSVKEASLLLGELAARLTAPGCLSAAQLQLMGDHFTTLLAETKHRGAFEQAYVGFTKLLARLWRERSSTLHALPLLWLSALLAALQGTANRPTTLCATRRSAGLPFMIQALVTTEIQVQGNPKCFHHCMKTLLQLARPPSLKKYLNKHISSHEHLNSELNQQSSNDNISINNDFETQKVASKHLGNVSNGNDLEVENDSGSKNESSHDLETRIHSLNILRALYRNSVLDEAVAGYVGEGIMVALSGFDGDTWAERNASTLLFSALLSRVFGARRSAAGLGAMTGRVFFLRYPSLYDFLLEDLQGGSSLGALSLLARLYPSALEGAESSLRLAALLPPAQLAASRSTLHTRRLAAEATLPLVAPTQYNSHLKDLLTTIQDKNIQRNHCHGVLLQLALFLASPRVNLEADLAEYLEPTTWILAQAVGDKPCYLIADEYVKVINLILWWSPSIITDNFLEIIENYLETLLFVTKPPTVSSGREICLSNSLYLLIIITIKYKKNIQELTLKALSHDTYDVTLIALNYLLILQNKLQIENTFQRHLNSLPKGDILHKLSTDEYIRTLCMILENNKYLECTHKALKVLTLVKNTQKYIIQVKTKIGDLSDEVIIRQLFELIQNEHENLTHIYLYSLTTFVSEKLRNGINNEIILEVVKVIFACSSSDNAEDTREVVVEFLERNFMQLLNMDLNLSGGCKFDLKATLWATAVTLMEDDDEALRQRIADVIVTSPTTQISKVLPSKAAETLREMVYNDEDGIALFVVLALLDFKCEVCLTDEINDECRVFDQSERYNIFLEETVWTDECADFIIKLSNQDKVVDVVLNIIEEERYRDAILNLCNNNIILFKKILNGEKITDNAINPKIELFVNKIKR